LRCHAQRTLEQTALHIKPSPKSCARKTKSHPLLMRLNQWQEDARSFCFWNWIALLLFFSIAVQHVWNQRNNWAKRNVFHSHWWNGCTMANATLAWKTLWRDWAIFTLQSSCSSTEASKAAQECWPHTKGRGKTHFGKTPQTAKRQKKKESPPRKWSKPHCNPVWTIWQLKKI